MQTTMTNMYNFLHVTLLEYVVPVLELLECFVQPVFETF